MSRGVMLALYRYLLRKLNKDTVNLVLQYVFGGERRLVLDEEGRMKGCGGNILSEKDLDGFLRYELC
jgi:hypothetical protein